MVATTSHIFSGKVDIASNLQVGSSHLFVDTENNRVGINTVSPDASLHVVGNVYATSFEGDGSLLTGIASNLEQIANNGNVTSNTVQFTNPNTGIVTTGNVEVGNKLSVNSLTSGSVPYIDGENTVADSYITQGVNTVSIASNLEVTGNVLITGDSYKIDSQSLEVKDRIIGVAYDNTLSGADTGILMEYPTKNIGLIHHGASGNPYAQEFTIGYTQNTATDTTILNDPANKITVNVLGDLHTQNNMTVDSGGSYFGDGTTLTGVALSTDMTSNAARITNVESVNGSQTGLITGLRTDVTTLTTANTVQASLITGIKTDMTSNASRITTLESANTVQGGLITAIETDVTDNASRITTLESANTVQGGLITAIETDVTDNASRITTLESANTVQGGLITAIETDVTDNASRITTLESANTVQGGLITAIETDVTDNASRITTLESANTVQGGLITAIETDVTDNASRITTLESANTVQASLITAIETNLTDNASRVTSLEATDAVFSGLLSGLRTDLDDTFITKTTDTTVISSNLEVTGNIFMRGERFIIESETTLINDAIIGIANNNTTSTTDVGILMQRPNANVALVHHGGTDTFTIGYTQDTLEATDITNDTANEINVNVLGQLHVQNNLTVGTGGSYYGDGTTLTGVALSTDMTSNASRITTLESANTVQGGLITAIETDVTDNASRITTLESANTVQGGLITAIETDVTDNASRITTLESANTVQGGLITAIETDVTDNASRITTLESANTVQGSLITAIETDVTDNALRITNLEASNVNIWSNLASNVLRIDELVASNTDIWSNLALVTLNDVVNVNNATSNTVLFTNTDTSLVASGNVMVSGNVTSITSIVSNATTMGTTKTFVVTVNGNYYIDGVERHLLELHQGQTYIFDMSDSTNSGHPLAFSTAFTGSSSSYTTGVVSNHDTVPSGTAGSKVTFSVPLNAPSSIYYYCTVHGAGMGSTGTASSISPTAELIVSGRVVASGNVEASAFKGDGTTLTGVALKVDLDSNVTRITNLETSNLTYTPLITGLRTDVDAHDTRLDLVEPRVSALEASNVDIWSNLELLTLNDVVNVNNATSNTVLFTNANTSLVASGNVTVSGNVTSTTSLISNAATLGTTKEFVVTHADGAFYIDGVQQDSLELHEHQTYLFDLTAPGSGHPFRLSTTSDGTHGGGSEYTTGTDYSSIANHLKFTVPSGAPSTLYYYCTIHSGMGGSISIASTAELIVSGRVVASGNVEASSFKGDGTELSGIALKTDLVSNVTRIASLETDMTANAARVDTLYTATEGDIIVATGTNTLGKLGIGGSGQVLKVASGGTTLEWAVESGGAAGAIVSNSSGITTGFTRGDLIYASADNTLNKLALGTANQVLKSDGTDVVWGTDGGAAASTLWLENGNKIYYNTDNVGIGTNAPAFKLDVHGTANVGALTATTLSVGGAAVALDADMTANAARVDALYTATTGDIIYATGTDTLGKLNIGGTTGHVLKVSASGTPEWAAESGDGGGSSKWTTVNTNEIHYSLGNVGIANTNPGHDLSVGSNLFVDDSGSNVLVIDGNVAAESMTIGGISIVPSYPLSSVTDTGNVTPHTIEFTNATTGIVTTGNVVVAGNVTAAYLYGDASNVTGIASNLHQIVENGNVTSNTVQFTNATTGLVTTANVEIGGELTVTGNVAVDTDTLFVDSVNNRVGIGTTIPGSTLHIAGDVNVVSNVNMLHTSNTASIKLNSNVVTEFPRSKKLIKYPRVALTANSDSGYLVDASTRLDNTDWAPYRAFNTIVGAEDGWHDEGGTYSNGVYTGTNSVTPVTGTAVSGEWIEIQLPEKIKLEKVRLGPRSTYTFRMPEDATILGSINGTDWYRVTSWSGQTYISGNNYITINVDSEQYYNYYVLVVEALEAVSSGNSVNIGEWELYGTPEYDPEADGVDVVVKSVPNVPNTDWLEVYYDAKNYSGSGDVQDETTNNRDAEMNATFDNGEIKAFNFTGAYTSNVTTSDHGLGTGDVTYTMSYWFKRTAVASVYDYLVMLGNGGVSHSASLMWINNNQLNLDHWGSALKVEEPIVLDKWYHVTAGHRGGVTPSLENDFVYINGKDVTTLNNPGQAPSAYTLAGSKITLGSSHLSTTEFFNGSIANFRLFNRALTSDEIYQLYAYQKEYFGHGDLSMTLKNGRLGIGTSEPRAALDVRGDINIDGRIFSGHLRGGTENEVDGYKIHTFTASGNFVVTTPGVVEYLLIGGGGGGGGTHGAGGGGGGFIQGHTLVKSGSHPIVVGGGGTGSTGQGVNGVNSTAFSLTAVGGGGGGRGYNSADSSTGTIGGSSGGSGPYVLTGSDSQDFGKVPQKTYANRYQGNAGGGGNNVSGAGHGGGGGGASGGGGAPISGYYAGQGISGAGGGGLISYITGSSVSYAGGGSGGRWGGSQAINVTGGVGGTSGGGGIGGATGASAQNATAGGINTGGGGGGGGDAGGRGGNGGSGIIVLRYPI